MKLTLIIVSLLVLGGVLYFVLRGEAQITNYPPKNTRIIAFGDSLVEGVGATKGNDLFSQLSLKLGRPIENLGVAGNTTADGIVRMEEALKRDPGTVIVLLGGNDTLRRIPIGTTEANLRRIFEGLQQKGAVVVFLGVRGGLIGSDREDMYERVSEAYGVVYVPDILDGILLSPELMHDGIHPNDAGYARIVARLEEVFRERGL